MIGGFITETIYSKKPFGKTDSITGSVSLLPGVAGGNANAPASGSVAVVYFSGTGHAKILAEKIAQLTGGKLMQIVPAVPYTSDDLNYTVADCRANVEQNNNDGAARPEVAAPVPDLAGFDRVYLGYPIWWGKAPRIILTYLEQADVSGKTLIPFCSSGGSGVEGSLPEIRAAATGAVVKEGRRLSRRVSHADIAAMG